MARPRGRVKPTPDRRQTLTGTAPGKSIGIRRTRTTAGRVDTTPWGRRRGALGNREQLMNADRPVDNAPYQSFTHSGFTIEGWSRAAVQSYWRIPELKVGFDLGGQPWDFMGTPTWFVSHTHLDHVAALPVYVARRRMMKMDPPTVYVPAESLEGVKKR